MSEKHAEEHSSLIKTPKQLVAVVVLAFVIPIVLIVMLTQLVTGAAAPDAGSMSSEAIAKRLKPVGEVAVDPNAPPPAPTAPVQVAAAPAAAPAAAAGGSAKGKSIYDATCMACHGTGAAGAPKAGDKAAWAPRLKQGNAMLVADAIKGKGAMPPKGGNMSLSDADIKAAVDYMISLVK